MNTYSSTLPGGYGQISRVQGGGGGWLGVRKTAERLITREAPSLKTLVFHNQKKKKQPKDKSNCENATIKHSHPYPGERVFHLVICQMEQLMFGTVLVLGLHRCEDVLFDVPSHTPCPVSVASHSPSKLCAP